MTNIADHSLSDRNISFAEAHPDDPLSFAAFHGAHDRQRGEEMHDKPPGFFEGTEMPTAGWWEALWQDPAGIVAKVGIKPGMEVIDLCSGDGWFTLQIARLARHVIAIDIDPALLEVARHRLAESGARNCDFIAGDAYDIARLWPQPVDFVFLANAFHGVPDQPRLARSVRDALKPSGRFAIINWHPLPRETTTVLGEPRGPRTELRMSPDQAIKAARSGDLKFAELIDVPPYHYGVVFERI
ncbi:MAG TPA: class I SAM-dependent methyltransferase [Xanthobacteraceae bacterium]|jgi:SAM-dependent methyltransferase|nr:class I SAM-dependent methyltransferase [Xanthobacteraceae bacterium]